MSMPETKKAKDARLLAEWNEVRKTHATAEKFAGKYTAKPQPKKTFKTWSPNFGGTSRDTGNAGLEVRSVPMTGVATVPHDPVLEEAKRALSGRVAPLFNKGGLQFISDQDMKDLATGSNRKHQ